MICERTGVDYKTIGKVFAGDPGVAIGTYLKVMAVLGMEQNFKELAARDEVLASVRNWQKVASRLGISRGEILRKQSAFNV
ncbi:MAG: hypothetical protein LRY53_07470 [Burkholderiaceae bacterium]|nr:hypothetical protein [Burkholderiaceae bacterium]MCD8515775.1 hypothetical protein [Burkholderiaceae bacterium]MCD8537027.1 hypothetical protein [Burkholderiaceae bacterium]MCD8565467.1 hypothetical protein [Burkholderiaceae bacterium]